MAKAFYRRVAELVAAKRNEEYKDIISLTRPKISFALLKSALCQLGDIGADQPGYYNYLYLAFHPIYYQRASHMIQLFQISLAFLLLVILLYP